MRMPEDGEVAAFSGIAAGAMLYAMDNIIGRITVGRRAHASGGRL